MKHAALLGYNLTMSSVADIVAFRSPTQLNTQHTRDELP